jgi:ATP-dependent RNA helicase DeaD
VSTFSDLGISNDLIKGLTEMNIVEPSEIQQLAIPLLLTSDNDFIGQASKK